MSYIFNAIFFMQRFNFYSSNPWNIWNPVCELWPADWTQAFLLCFFVCKNAEVSTHFTWTGLTLLFSCSCCSSLVAVSWQWWSTTSWPLMAAAVSCRCAEVRLWRSWSGSTTSPTGAWCGPQTVPRPRRALFPAPCSASLTRGHQWRWKGSLTTKVGGLHSWVLL